MNTQKNSAEQIIELRSALHKLDESSMNGVSDASVSLASEVSRIAGELRDTVVRERVEIVSTDQARRLARKAA